MSNYTIEIVIFYTLIGIIGYFLIQTMLKININEKVANENTTNIALLKQDHQLKYEYLTTDFKELKEVMKDLTKEIKELNTKMIKQ